ncbi:MAG: hypothetical protein DMD79_22720 [Candidatus Rokuibacteriota bacterium]|nr:MAG: hypothetical protein DMD79_22720 [Candidatus Rokubacteria bacterium]
MTERSLTSVLDDLQRRGFTEAFGATAQGLRVLGSDRTLGRGEFVIVEHHRFEGISDPRGGRSWMASASTPTPAWGRPSRGSRTGPRIARNRRGIGRIVKGG